MSLVAIIVSCIGFSACEPGGGAGLVSGLTGAEGEPWSNPWLGVYQGDGRGAIAGTEVMPAGVSLTIRPDADSVRIESCSGCVTVRLDTLFLQVNVPPVSLVSLEMAHTADGIQRSLRLDRYSAGGGIGNVVNANLSLSGALTGDVEYVLERR